MLTAKLVEHVHGGFGQHKKVNRRMAVVVVLCDESL